jgi:hypothetical protein
MLFIKIPRADMTPCNLNRIVQTEFLMSAMYENHRARRGHRE